METLAQPIPSQIELVCGRRPTVHPGGWSEHPPWKCFLVEGCDKYSGAECHTISKRPEAGCPWPVFFLVMYRSLLQLIVRSFGHLYLKFGSWQYPGLRLSLMRERVPRYGRIWRGPLCNMCFCHLHLHSGDRSCSLWMKLVFTKNDASPDSWSKMIQPKDRLSASPL